MALLKINEKYVKQAVFAVTVLFLIAEALFFAPISIPHKLCLPVGVLVLSSLWLTPWEIFFALLFSVLGDYAGTCKIFLLQMGSFAVAHIFYVLFFVRRFIRKEYRHVIFVVLFIIRIFYAGHNNRSVNGAVVFNLNVV